MRNNTHLNTNCGCKNNFTVEGHLCAEFHEDPFFRWKVFCFLFAYKDRKHVFFWNMGHNEIVWGSWQLFYPLTIWLSSIWVSSMIDSPWLSDLSWRRCAKYKNHLLIFLLRIFGLRIIEFIVFEWLHLLQLSQATAVFMLNTSFSYKPHVRRSVFQIFRLFFRTKFGCYLFFLTLHSFKIAKYPIPKPEQQSCQPWRHYDIIILKKQFFSPEKLNNCCNYTKF